MKVELILRLLTDNQKLLLQRAYPNKEIIPLMEEGYDTKCLMNLGFFEKTDLVVFKLSHKGNNLISEILNEST
jgi:hypothetical protein